MSGDEIRQNFVGTWVIKSRYYGSSYYAEQTINADGSGQSTESDELIRWTINGDNLQYVCYDETYSASDKQLVEEWLNESSYTVGKWADGVLAIYDETFVVPTRLFIDSDSVWGQRLIKAYQ